MGVIPKQTQLKVYYLAARMMDLSTNWYVKCKISVEHGRTGTCRV